MRWLIVVYFPAMETNPTIYILANGLTFIGVQVDATVDGFVVDDALQLQHIQQSGRVQLVLSPVLGDPEALRMTIPVGCVRVEAGKASTRNWRSAVEQAKAAVSGIVRAARMPH